MKVLSEDTLIPLGLLSAFLGVTMWLTTIYRSTEVNATQIQEIKLKAVSDATRVDDKLDRLNEKVDRILEKVNSK